MAISCAVSGTPLHTTSDAATYTVTANVTAGRTYVLFTHARLAPGPIGACSPSATGETFTEIGTAGGVTFSADERRVQAFRFNAAATNATLSITLDWGATTECADGVVIEVTGDDTASPVVQSATANGNATSGSVTLAAFASADNRPLACFVHKADEATTPGSGFTELDDGSYAAPTTGTATEWHSSSADTTADASWATSTQWAGFAIELAVQASQTVAHSYFDAAATFYAPAVSQPSPQTVAQSFLDAAATLHSCGVLPGPWPVAPDLFLVAARFYLPGVTGGTLTPAQIVTLLEGDVRVTPGLELLDADDTFIADVSDDLVEFTVRRASYATIHAEVDLVVAREMDWASQRVRPYVTVAGLGSTLEQRWDMGVYLLSVPSRPAGSSPPEYRVHGWDKLLVLDTPYAASYRAAVGDAPLSLVETLISDAGETRVRLDQSAAATTLSQSREWPFDERTTRLSLINDLLGMVGYRGLWVDRDGYYRSEPYTAPSGQAVAWTYDASDPNTALVGADRTFEADYTDTPNRWVFIRDDPEAGLSSAGSGMYVVTNQSDGPSSIDGRGGRVITRTERLSVASQTALETLGDRMVEADKATIRRLILSTGPNPTHWHFDVVHVTDHDLVVDGNYLSYRWEWRVPSEGPPDDMRHELKAV